MKPSTLLLMGALSLEFLIGCGDKFPQYSGKFTAVSSSYTNPEFAGEKRLPFDLTITHRMKYVSSTWDDKLRFEFMPRNPSEIGGTVIFDLELLTNPKESSFPQEYFRGENIHSEQKYYGGAFCNYQYQYQAFAILNPTEAALSQVYPEQGELLYTDPSGMPIHETFDPDNFEPDPETICGWYDALDQNCIVNKEGEEKCGVITLELYISRKIQSTLDGCDGNSYLPHDGRGAESLHVVYYSTELHDTEDPRIGFDDLLNDDIIPRIDLFKDVISDVKDLD